MSGMRPSSLQTGGSSNARHRHRRCLQRSRMRSLAQSNVSGRLARWQHGRLQQTKVLSAFMAWRARTTGSLVLNSHDGWVCELLQSSIHPTRSGSWFFSRALCVPVFSRIQCRSYSVYKSRGPSWHPHALTVRYSRTVSLILHTQPRETKRLL